ncbi:MAG: hypothetical protein IPN78_03960 [Candidatus Accumulibacter sp.]|nr:hypothetical protein [Candidatus Accumulibacter propinquus]
MTVFVVNGITAAALPATLVLFFVTELLQAEAWAALSWPFTSSAARRLSAAIGGARQSALAVRQSKLVASMLMVIASLGLGLGAGDVVHALSVCSPGAALGHDATATSRLTGRYSRTRRLLAAAEEKASRREYNAYWLVEPGCQ